MTKILVVDDDKDVRNATTRSLKLHEFEVETADCAQDALLLLEKNRYDIIVSDFTMPRMNGLQFYEKVGATYAHRFVLCTGDSIPHLQKTSPVLLPHNRYVAKGGAGMKGIFDAIQDILKGHQFDVFYHNNGVSLGVVAPGKLNGAKYTKVGNVKAADLEDLFENMNVVHGEELPVQMGIRSFSMGDVAVDEAGQAWFCASADWIRMEFL